MGGARAVAMDAFPSGVVGGIEVVKTLTPDMDAEGLGGSINLLSRSMPSDGKPFVETTTGIGLEPLRNTAVWQGDITVGSSFGLTKGNGPFDSPSNTAFQGNDFLSNPRPFSILGNYSYNEDQRGIDDVEEDYNSIGPNGHSSLQDLQLRWYRYHRVREGGYAELSFKPNEQSEFYLRALQTGYHESADKHRLELDSLDGSNGTLTDNGGGSFTATGASLSQKFTDSSEQVQTNLISVGGHTLLADFVKADFRGSWTKGTDQFTNSYSISFKGPKNLTINYDTSNPADRTFSVPGVNVTDPSLYNLKSISNSPSNSYDEEWGGALDFTIPTRLAGYEGQAKVGTLIRLRDRGVTPSELDANLAGTTTLASSATGGNQIYYNNQYDIGPNADPAAILRSVASWTANIDTAMAGYERDSENVYAGYGQYSTTIGKFSLLGGARVEATEGAYHANLATTDAGGNTTYTPNTNNQNYVNVFPSVQGKFQVTPDMITRATFSTGIARPGFNQITAAKSVDLGQGTVSQGNPTLKPTTGTSYDLTSEYYLANHGLASVGAFYKTFDNYIVATQANGSYQGTPGFVFTSYENISGATAGGIELNFIQPLSFLPKPLDGLTFSSNYTYVHSEGQLRPNEKKEPLPETSPENFNVALSYEKGPITVRLAGSYVSTNLFAVGADRSSDIFSMPRFRLDLGSGYQFTDNFQAYFSAKNLTNTKLEFTQGQSSANPIQRESYDATYITGVRMKF